MREQIIEVAKSYLGTPYSKLDCSAFVRAVFRKFGYELPRTSVYQAKHLYNKQLTTEFSKSTSVKDIMAKLQKGDVVFWTKACKCGRWKEIHHVSIYDQDGMNYESSSSRGKVVYRSLWESSTWQIILIADMTSLLIPAQGDDIEIMLKKGDKGELVKAWQRALVEAGYPMSPYGVDGSFGSVTESATKAFQKSASLTETGVVDTATACAMFNTDNFKIYTLKNNITNLQNSEADLKSKVTDLTGKIDIAKPAVETLKILL